jgi:hypothetical protein
MRIKVYLGVCAVEIIWILAGEGWVRAEDGVDGEVAGVSAAGQTKALGVPDGPACAGRSAPMLRRRARKVTCIVLFGPVWMKAQLGESVVGN